MSLPKWVEDITPKNEPSIAQLYSALVIAWEALENTPANKIKSVWYVQKCKEAMRRIEELGK